MNDKINSRLKTLHENKDAVNWVMERQAELRGELMTFYKKDLKEIKASLDQMDAQQDNSFSVKAIEEVTKHFIDQWRRSYDLITPEFSSVEDVASVQKTSE